VKAQWIRGVSD